MTERYVDAHWYFSPLDRAFRFVRAGYYEEGKAIADGSLSLDPEEVLLLIPVLEDAGYIKPRLDERLRSEDLKITHRLLDLLDKTCSP